MSNADMIPMIGMVLRLFKGAKMSFMNFWYFLDGVKHPGFRGIPAIIGRHLEWGSNKALKLPSTLKSVGRSLSSVQE